MKEVSRHYPFFFTYAKLPRFLMLFKKYKFNMSLTQGIKIYLTNNQSEILSLSSGFTIIKKTFDWKIFIYIIVSSHFLLVFHYVFLSFFSFFGGTGICKADGLSLDSWIQAHFSLAVLVLGYQKYLTGLVWNCRSTDLSFPSSQYCRHKFPATGFYPFLEWS
jgi:hypothetical protein